MISSRNAAEIEFGGGTSTLSEVRRKLKEEIEAELLFGEPVFEVYINEDEPAPAASLDLWEFSLRVVDDADILLVLYSGDAGWTREGNPIGICHAEVQRALHTQRGKVRVVRLPERDGESPERDRIFREAMDRLAAQAPKAETGEDVIEECRRVLARAVPELARLGVRESRRGRYDSGEALDWSRLDFATRRGRMEDALREGLARRPGAEALEGGEAVVVPIDGVRVLFACHAIPAAFTVASAREMVGRPHLRDHEWVPRMEALGGDVVGPVHLIACNRGVTETQATGMIGFPDTTVVRPPFGVWVADEVQKIQFVLLRDCRDRAATLHGLQRFFEWLSQAEESARLSGRARSRRHIVQAIHDEKPRT
ncbi:MAG TPA: hypothetical protein VFR81_08525 [Longimicrobium sp.]|nr:hypothetical protein [Longimicrobium sp.]